MTVVSSLYADGRTYDHLMPVPPDRIQFWLDLARAYGEPVLELGAGTGAIAIPLAQAGVTTVGLELAETMLAEARKKAAQEGVDVTWVQDDMRDFTLDRRFNLVLLPSNNICHIHTWQELGTMLAAVRRHLLPAGRLAISVFVPSLQHCLRTRDREYSVASCIDPETGEYVRVTERSSYDPAAQIRYSTLYTQVGDQAPFESGRLDMRMWFPQELDALLWHNGFAIEHKWDSTRRGPFVDTSAMQFFVLHPRDE